MRESIGVLVLEDDQELLNAMVRALEFDGYDVRGAEGSARALELAQEFRFDIVVADVRMEGLDGLAALGRLKAHQPGLQSLVVSGYSAEEDSLRAVALGVQGFLKKPFGLDRFLNEVERLAGRVLEERRARDRERWVRRLTVWALRSLAASVEPGLRERGELARRLAEAAGCDPLSAEMATLVRLLLEHPVDLDMILEGLPQPVLLLVEGTDRDSLLARVVLTACLGKPPKEPDPLLLEAWERLQTGTAPRPRRPSQLLSLALTLEGTGDPEAALELYEELAAHPEPRPDVVAALQGLARLRPEQAPEVLRRAFDLARQLGPVREATTLLESGIQLAQTGSPHALKVLERAVERFGDLGMPAEEARARLALLSVDPREPEGLEAAVARLNRPDQLPALLESSGWLLPLLLKLRPQEGEALRALRRLLQQNPARVRRLVQDRALDEPSRLYLVEQLGPWARPTLELLARDPEPSVRGAASMLLQTEASEASPPLVRFFSFGFFEVVRGEERLAEDSWHTRKVWQLLAFLLFHAGHWVSEEVVREILWPEARNSGKSLYHACSLVRGALRPPDWPVKLNYVERSRDGLRLNPELPVWHDHQALQDYLEAGRRRLSEEALDLSPFWSAVKLYRGPYLQNCYSEWAVRERDRLWLELSAGLRDAASAALERGLHQAALELAGFVLLYEPSDQPACVTAMEAELALGLPHLAIQRFETCSSLLARDYGLEPSVDMQRALLKARHA